MNLREHGRENAVSETSDGGLVLTFVFGWVHLGVEEAQ